MSSDVQESPGPAGARAGARPEIHLVDRGILHYLWSWSGMKYRLGAGTERPALKGFALAPELRRLLSGDPATKDMASRFDRVTKWTGYLGSALGFLFGLVLAMLWGFKGPLTSFARDHVEAFAVTFVALMAGFAGMILFALDRYRSLKHMASEYNRTMAATQPRQKIAPPPP